MKMAKPSRIDIEMALNLTKAFDAIDNPWNPIVPDEIKLSRYGDDEDERLDFDDPEQVKRTFDHLISIVKKGSLSRVIYSLVLLLDLRNKCVDPDVDFLDHHPETKLAMFAKKPRQLSEWTDDFGPVIWWVFPIRECPWVGTPNDEHWPGYHSHWTPLLMPEDPA